MAVVYGACGGAAHLQECEQRRDGDGFASPILRPRHPKPFEGNNNSDSTIAHTIPHPIQVMVGWAACHSRIVL
jgi:hypothetical protein